MCQSSLSSSAALALLTRSLVYLMLLCCCCCHAVCSARPMLPAKLGILCGTLRTAVMVASNPVSRCQLRASLVLCFVFDGNFAFSDRSSCRHTHTHTVAEFWCIARSNLRLKPKAYCRSLNEA
uniref:Putative secreted protein n=1 Tax=Anopheles darlingi TaxID=43151 RepID=A0A2M4DDU0_ANODA